MNVRVLLRIAVILVFVFFVWRYPIQSLRGDPTELDNLTAQLEEARTQLDGISHDISSAALDVATQQVADWIATLPAVPLNASGTHTASDFAEWLEAAVPHAHLSAVGVNNLSGFTATVEAEPQVIGFADGSKVAQVEMQMTWQNIEECDAAHALAASTFVVDEDTGLEHPVPWLVAETLSSSADCPRGAEASAYLQVVNPDADEAEEPDGDGGETESTPLPEGVTVNLSAAFVYRLLPACTADAADSDVGATCASVVPPPLFTTERVRVHESHNIPAEWLTNASRWQGIRDAAQQD